MVESIPPVVTMGETDPSHGPDGYKPVLLLPLPLPGIGPGMERRNVTKPMKRKERFIGVFWIKKKKIPNFPSGCV